MQAGHGGFAKTLARVTKLFWWQRCAADVQKWCKQCHVCQTMKHDSTKKAGQLVPLPVPVEKFEVVGIDFMTGLPDTGQGYDALMTVTCHLSKYVELIPCSTKSTSAEVLKLFLQKVVCRYGFPKTIVSDRDSRFRSDEVWRQYFSGVGVKLAFTTAYHPQADGQSEATNKEVGKVLRCITMNNGFDWVDNLSRVMLAINGNVHSSTGVSPAQVLYGFQPLDVCDVEVKNAGVVHRSAGELMKQDRQLLEKVRGAVQAAKDRQAAQYNKGRKIVKYAVGDEVLLSTAHLATWVSKKFKKRFEGPFTVVKVWGVNVQLKLPDSWRAAGVHDVFHVEMVRMYHRGPDRAPSAFVHGDDCEIDYIRSHRKVGAKKTQLEFEVVWKTVDGTFQSEWLPESDLVQAQWLVHAYKKRRRL